MLPASLAVCACFGRLILLCLHPFLCCASLTVPVSTVPVFTPSPPPPTHTHTYAPPPSPLQGSCYICCESMQILWVFFLSCVIDIVMQVIAVIEVATIDRTKMTLNGMKIAQWQYTMSLPVCGTGVLIK